MSGTGQAILESIRADPSADGPRYVYADWLQEQGQPERAELIRLQLQRSQLRRWTVEHLDLRMREQRLLTQWSDRWRAHLPSLGEVYWGPFERGFCGHAVFGTADVVAQHASACRDATVVDAVTVHRIPQGRTLASETLGGLRSLRLLGDMSGLEHGSLGWLDDPGVLRTLRLLRLVCRVGPFEVRQLLDSSHLSQLTTLSLNLRTLGDDVLTELAGVGTLHSLANLDVSGWARDIHGDPRHPHVRRAGIRALVSWEGARRLRALNLMYQPIGEEGLRDLVSSPLLAGLEGLALSRAEPRYLTPFGRGVPTLGPLEDAHPSLDLQVLVLTANRLTASDVDALVRARCLRGLKVLELAVTMEPVPAMEALAQAPWFDTLEVLRMPSGGVGLLRVLAERRPARLHTLEVPGLHFAASEEAMRVLVESDLAAQLRSLNLTSSSLGEEALRLLGRATGELAELKHLVVARGRRHRPGDREAVQRLSTSELSRALDHLDVRDAMSDDPFRRPYPIDGPLRWWS